MDSNSFKNKDEREMIIADVNANMALDIVKCTSDSRLILFSIGVEISEDGELGALGIVASKIIDEEGCEEIVRKLHALMIMNKTSVN